MAMRCNFTQQLSVNAISSRPQTTWLTHAHQQNHKVNCNYSTM